MPLPVTLLSGRKLEVAVCPGRPVRELKRKLAEQLAAESAQLHILAAASELQDSAAIPADGDLQAVVGPRASWLDDGSGSFTDLGEGVLAVSGAPDPLSGARALYSRGISDGEQYFEVEVLAGRDVSVGVATLHGFNCELFSGLLLNGTGSVVACGGPSQRRPRSLGEEVKAGQVVGVLVELSRLDVSVTLWQNGRCLGLAFKASRGSQETALYPVVRSFARGDRCRISFGRCPHTTRAWERKARPADAHPAEGLWSLRSLLEGPSLDEASPTELSGGGQVKLLVRAALAGPWLRFPFKQVSAAFARLVQPFCMDLKAVNRVSLVAMCRHALWASARGQGALWIAEGNSELSDRGRGGRAGRERAEDLALERRCCEALAGAGAWYLEETADGKTELVLTGPGVQMVWRSLEEPMPEPCTGGVLY